MVGLDSLYAMLARPIRLSFARKRLMVEQTDKSASIADDHRTPESQLPPSLERRKSPQDRRRGDRRGAPASQQEREDASKKELAEHEATNSPLPRIDIDI